MQTSREMSALIFFSHRLLERTSHLSRAEAATAKSHEEVVHAIQSLTDAQWGRLKIIARRYAYSISEEDLLQEAFTAVLSGDRHCPINIDIVLFLAGAMRSIASGEHQKTKTRPQLMQIASWGDQKDGSVDPIEPSIPADDWIAREEHAVKCRKEIIDLFADDEQAKDIIVGRMEGMNAAEIQELTELDSVGYSTKLRLIRRRIDKKFPKGWRS